MTQEYHYKPLLNLKSKRLRNILYWATEVKHLGMIPAMKFLMDENCQTQKTSSTSTDCSTLSGNAGIHQTTKNATGIALNCLLKNQVQSQVTTVLTLLPIIIIIPLFFIIFLL